MRPTDSSVFRGAGACRRRAFTLVELMVAMVVLVVLMGMLFAIISGAQEAYSLAESNAQTYEKAHILLDQLSRDLRGAIASNTPGREVPIWVAPTSGAGAYDPDPNAGNSGIQPDLICVASAGQPSNDVATARTNKVRYSFHYDPADAAGMYAVRRSIDPEVNTSGNPNAGWGFYGTTAANETIGANGVPQWVSVSDARRVLVSGVEEFRIDPYPAFTGTRNILPRAFVVNVTLVDERALALPEPLRTQRLDQSRRTFRKIIFVGGEGT